MKKINFFQAYKVFHTSYTMKKSIFIIIFCLMLPIVFAEIDIQQDKDNYNLGDKISVSASIIKDVDMDGFFKANLECTNYVMQYFVTPITLEKNFRTSINVPDLTAKKDMLGDCKIKAILESDNITDEQYTNEFKVKNDLNVGCEAAEATPGEELMISCNVKTLSLDPLKSGTAKLNYKDNYYTINVENGIFNFDIPIQYDTPAGIQEMIIEVEDSKGNYGDLIFEFEVRAIPTMLEINVNQESFKPYEEIEIRPVLYDHINNQINTTITLEVLDPTYEELISEDVLSSEVLDYAFDTFALPGDYKIIAYSQGLTNEKIVKVENFSKLEMAYSNEKVLVKNIGNIIYDDKITIILENEKGEKFLIEKKLNLKPGEEIEIDLSKEVPYGTYTIILQEIINKNNETNVAEDVVIHDNRPVSKKVGRGLGIITGAAVTTVNFMAARPLATGIILIVIILCIVLFYSRDFIRSRMGIVKIKLDKKKGIDIKIPRKKEGEVEGLFEDYKYGKQ